MHATSIIEHGDHRFGLSIGKINPDVPRLSLDGVVDQFRDCIGKAPIAYFAGCVYKIPFFYDAAALRWHQWPESARHICVSSFAKINRHICGSQIQSQLQSMQLVV
ncbi:MAG TPA: hypothetical protein VFU86_16395 [Terriglobales bacterium]|nr:hypothetical protein [Terriglobales bacterium]